MAGPSISASNNSASKNGTDIWAPVYGWVDDGRDRGTIDILWSSIITIVLCIWVSTHPNALAPKDKWYHGFIDKFNLAMIGLLGPDFLFGIAVGQLANAGRSVKQFKAEPRLSGGLKWTYTHALFVDMGGIHLKSPDYPEGFPINAEQLFYLVKHGFVEFPDMDSMDIKERNSVDTLSRFITLWQALFFFITEMDRIKNGLPITPLELTALSFTFAMFATSICWYLKPSISYPRFIETKFCNERQTKIEDIRKFAATRTHVGLAEKWYRTPLDFISRREFRIDTHWAYYKRISEIVGVNLYGRPIKQHLWDRFPSDIWFPIGSTTLPLSLFLITGFSASFMFGWNFYFPTATEQLTWRIFSVYHMAFSLYGGGYYSVEAWRSFKRTRQYGTTVAAIEMVDPEAQQLRSDDSSDSQPKNKPRGFVDGCLARIRSWRNISADNDPDMTVPLKVVAPTTIVCALYVFCRGYFYIEDFVSLREQPRGIYITGNKFLPLIANP
ncbi:uncharacterized protein CTRU02_213958 [Colletotrichum truncatum]|uniref:Uncharacterized protein n=1 Tax=Colletotrichum truncatum TaxID=5467 RepID=A0ACC3YH46_COLTU|nr:uncharacterized protein CTRU02_06271 [Colletotrichum truncatum]KAF6792775.1 hypothetical protein CTRU02_06271 [Colletotrichum truncatum]